MKLNSSANRYFSVFPVFFVGIEDALGPCGLSILLFFIVILVFSFYVQRHLIWFGLTFLVSIVVTIVLLIVGFFDQMLFHPKALGVIRGTYLALGSFFIFVGGLNFYYWWQLRRKKNDVAYFTRRLKYLYLEKRDDRPFFVKWLRNSVAFVGCVGSAFYLTICSSIMAHDYHIYVKVIHLMAKGKHAFACFLIGIYSISFVLPLFFLWIMTVVLVKKKKVKRILDQSIGKIKIVFSALFLGTGIGLIYLFV